MIWPLESKSPEDCPSLSAWIFQKQSFSLSNVFDHESISILFKSLHIIFIILIKMGKGQEKGALHHQLHHKQNTLRASVISRELDTEKDNSSGGTRAACSAFLLGKTVKSSRAFPAIRHHDAVYQTHLETYFGWQAHTRFLQHSREC